MPFAAAGAIAGVAGAAASVIGSSMQADAIGDAQSSANAEQRAARDQARADLEPWRTAGAGALPRINALLGLDGSDPAAVTATLRSMPGYRFTFDEATRAVDTGAAARGLLRSGSTLRAEQDRAAGLADTSFDKQFARYMQLATLGQTAASGSATASLKTGEGIAQTDTSAGSAQSALIGNQSTAIQQGIGSIYGAGGGGTGWNRLFGGGGTVNASAGLGGVPVNQLMTGSGSL